ncbi:MAG TPA: DedA family protein [Aggregicoccus sp.]|nr:DedA family protein [Aggregicoccus sp.]
MEDFLLSLLGNSQGFIAYLAVFAVLVICGLGVPLPEDITLIAGGYLAHKGAADLTVMMGVGFLGILVGDSLIYAAGRRLGTRVGSKPGGFFARIVTPEKRARVEGMFAKHGQKIVMIARFLPGVRAVTYFTAGSARMSYGRFILWDGLAALASAPIFIWLGFHFGGELTYLIDKLKEGQVVVFGGLAALAIGFYLYNRRRAAARAQQAALQPSLSPLLAGDAAQGPQDAAKLFEVPERSAQRAELRK